MHFDGTGVGIATTRDGYGKVFHEGGQCAEFTRKNEIDQRPELAEIVLHRRARQNESVRCAKLRMDRFDARESERERRSYRFASGGDLSVGIADLMAFVENEVVPWEGDQSVVMNENVRVGRDEDAGGGGAHLLDQSYSFLALEGATLVQDGHAKFWPPFMKFVHPLVQQC